MRLVIQRVSRAQVVVETEVVGAIGAGFLVLVGLCHGDTAADVEAAAKKLVGLRVFEDDEGRMNLALEQLEPRGEILAVSQFTLYGDLRKGRRPSFVDAMRPEAAKRLFDHFVDAVRSHGFDCPTGVFGAHMDVSLSNDGPVTLVLEVRDGAVVRIAP